MIHFPIRTLKILVVFYLLLPNLLFHFFWFKLEVAILTIPAMIISFVLYAKEQSRTGGEPVYFSSGQLLTLFLLAVSLVVLSGIPGLSYQTNDYVGHNSKYFDLFSNPWPIYFEGADTFGCYYWGFYLVPAFCSKLLGHLSVFLLFLWTCIGFFGGVLLVFILLKKNLFRTMLFFFIGGVGHTAKVLFGFVSGLGFERPVVFVEVWNLLNQLLWAPNQLIPVLLIASLLYYEGILNRNIFSCLFPLTLIFIWSVFPTLVLSLLVLFTFFYFGGWQQLLQLNYRKFLLTLVVPLGVCLPVLVYFLSSSGIPIRGFLWSYDPLTPIVMDYLSCVMLDVALLWFVWRYLIRNNMEVPDFYFYSLLISVPVLALYRLGFANDWLVRGTMPIFMILFFAILRGQTVVHTDYKTGKFSYRKYALIAIVMFCSLGPVSYLYRSLTKNVLVKEISGEESFVPTRYDKYSNVYEAIKDHHGLPEARQYLGNKESAYWKYLGKKTTP